jgi:hypothetical protein
LIAGHPKHGAGIVTGRFANKAFGNYGGLQTQPSVRNWPSSKPNGGRGASWPHLADSYRHLQREPDSLTPICSTPMLGQTFSLFPYPTSLSQPRNTAAFLHFVTHYLDHLWSSTRLGESCTLITLFWILYFNPPLQQLGPGLSPLDPPRTFLSLEF